MQKLAQEDKTDRRETSITTLYKDKIASSINNGIQDDANTKSSSNPSTLTPTPRDRDRERVLGQLTPHFRSSDPTTVNS